MRESTVIYLGLLVVGLGGCTDNAVFMPEELSSSPTQRSYPPDGAHADGCYLSAELCYKLDSAISSLENDENSFCQDLGDAARDRFNSTSYGFVPGSEQPGDLAYVPMTETGGGPYGWEDTSGGNTYVNEQQLNEMGVTVGDLYLIVAHEESHHVGWPGDHNPPPPPLPCFGY